MKHTSPSLPAVILMVTKLELGGAQKVVLNLFNQLKQQGFTVYLISGAAGVLTSLVQDQEGVILLPLLEREILWYAPWKECKAYKSLIHELKKIMERHQGNVLIHTHSTKAGLLGRWAAWWVGIKQRVHTIHGFGFHAHQGWVSWALTYILELITAAITTRSICVSQSDRRAGAKLFPHFMAKTTLIRASVDDIHLKSARVTGKSRLHDEPFIVGTISCFKPQKNLMDLLKAFAWVHARNPHVRLEIIGDGQQRELLQNFVAQHNLQDAVVFHGWLMHVQPILHTWHAFALTSLWEGLPCSVIEARLARLPVISYKTGGIPEVIFHGVNGLLYPQKSWEKLAQGLLQLSTDEGLYAQMTHYPDTLKEFTCARMVQRHAQLYQELR